MSRALLPARKNIALVAHDHRKDDLLKWCLANKNFLSGHGLSATGTTGKLLEEELELPVKKFMSGPLGGDSQIGSAIVENKIHALVFFWDPLESVPHDPDVKALLRLATMWNIPLACNEASADFLAASPLFKTEYKRNLNAVEVYKRSRL